MSYNEPYKSFPAQRAKTVFTLAPEVGAFVKRRPIEVVRGIDDNGDWLFGLEIRMVNEIVLAKARALSADGVSVSVLSCALNKWPESVEVKHVNNASGGALTITFGYQDLELETIARSLYEFRGFAPDEQELIAPWVSFALTA
jgi:hypothetical protein